MNTQNELHVIFGTGPVGLSLAEELLTRGKRVRLVNRSGKGQIPAGAELMAGDASQLTNAQELSQGAAVIYNATHAPYEQWPEVLPRLQENMIESAAATGAKLVVIDTLYLYGETRGKPMTEAMAHTATSRKGRMRAQLAWGYLQAHRVGKARVTIGRAADFYGPRVLNSSLGQYVFPAALSGQPVLTLGNIDLPHSYSYMPDISKGLATLGERDDALGREWLLPVAPTITTRQVLQIIGQELGQLPQIFNVPTIEQARATGIFDETFAHEYTELFYQYTEPQIVDSSAIEQIFGLHATPWREALRATIRWYQEQSLS
ncbi:epimerase [Ktedonobacter sp. SOSP1-52]|uniref:NAD-dependent epimerase/dehydratase family protein n=1 Tax=Ktedonobacter sp. SOSP1-52 TaxID=2778366 RepID=UPI00191632A4|nr:NAD-dependent epimerase/dehydratase family protein [Ktedonobacter sp. SOSP1-52]GHO62479.1 epimerase [Ktedonobacter sp. SOSP1-52]